MDRYTRHLLCTICLITTICGVHVDAQACRPLPPPLATRELTLTLNPRIDAPENCLSVAQTWDDSDPYYDAMGFGIALISRCGTPVDVSVQDCADCIVTVLEDGQRVEINRAEIEHEDDNGQIVFLWSDGERGGKITLLTTYVPPKKRDGPACPEPNTALCAASLTHKPTMPSGLVVSFLMLVGVVWTRKKDKLLSNFKL